MIREGGRRVKITPIRLRRLNQKIKADAAIKELDISKSTFYKLEQGHYLPGRDLIFKLSQLYKCSVDDIYKDLDIGEV